MLNQSHFLKFAAFILAAVLILVIASTPTPAFAALTDCTGVSEIPSAECDALVALYNSTNGANWTDHTNWLETNTPCDWSFVACDTGHVTHLYLHNNNLVGTIPPELGNLTELQELWLGANTYTGSGIPPELGSLSNLTTLNIFGSHLSGSIPTQLGNLTSLQHLDLAQNDLSGSIPTSLGNLASLLQLDLYTNNLTGTIPLNLASLSSLQTLGLFANHLTGSIPTQLATLTNLQVLGLDNNSLTGTIPSQLGSLTSLHGLGLSRNGFTGSIPAALGNLANLQTLYLNFNSLTGSIPTQLGSLSNLQHLALDNNQLSGSIPVSFGNLTSIQDITMGNNPFTGSIPASFGNLINLQELYLLGTNLSGSIPPELGNMTSLRVLHLMNNKLTGSIPTQLGNLTNLTYLELGLNQLTGSIPASLGSLINLTDLNLDNNQLTGGIPPELGNLTNLQSLYMDNNQLTGSIPTELGNLTSLRVLHLPNNQLSGSIPTQLGNLANLQILYLGTNHLGGSIPTQLGNLTQLQDLAMRSNRLSGSIPASLGNLTNLQNLDLGGGNQLSGDIPPSLVNLTNLLYISLDFNMLTASDANLSTWLDSKQLYWYTTQTIAPSNVQADALSSTSMQVSWTPIAYTDNGGDYEVGYSGSVSGPFSPVNCITANKSASSCEIDNLAPNTPYYFAVLTHTPAHDVQQNDLLSDFSTAVLGTTATPPVNDNFADAIAIDTGFVPFSDTQNVLGASLESGEPVAMCGGSPALRSVWYKYTALDNNILSLNTTGSDYDTVLSVWTGAGLGALVSAGCNDNVSPFTTSALTLTTNPGTTYYIRVSSHSDSHTDMIFKVSATSPAGEAPPPNYVTTSPPTLSWNPITWATGYSIQVSRSSSFSTTAFSADVPADQLSVPTDPLGEGVYYWRVSANNGLTWGKVNIIVINLP
ncbi:MAG: leucine-rich repeat domain-containing protein [Chloroflexota bacterium]